MSQEPAFFKDRAAWRRWLQKNHERVSEIWVLAFKVHTKKQCLSYFEALEEAICYGWIDSRLRRIDDEKHVWRFVPRKQDSIWSMGNRERAEKLIKEGRMTAMGLEKVNAAKRCGEWDKAYVPSRPPKMPKDLKDALLRNPKAWQNFKEFAKSYRTIYIYWINAAKREETRKKRIKEVVRRAERSLKPFMA